MSEEDKQKRVIKRKADFAINQIRTAEQAIKRAVDALDDNRITLVEFDSYFLALEDTSRDLGNISNNIRLVVQRL